MRVTTTKIRTSKVTREPLYAMKNNDGQMLREQSRVKRTINNKNMQESWLVGWKHTPTHIILIIHLLITHLITDHLSHLSTIVNRGALALLGNLVEN